MKKSLKMMMDLQNKKENNKETTESKTEKSLYTKKKQGEYRNTRYSRELLAPVQCS